MPVVFVQDKFGYCKTIDTSAFEKNKEQIETEYPYVYKTETTERAIIFGSSGNMYQIKMEKVPLQKIKDKGKPIDNLSKFDSSKETIVGVIASNIVDDAYFFFVTKDGLIKMVDTKEYDTVNSKVVATKLAKGDEVVKVMMCYADFDVVIRTSDNFMLRLDPKDIPELKRATKGVKGIKLSNGATVIDAYILDRDSIVKVNDKNIKLEELPVGTRASKGTKIK